MKPSYEELEQKLIESERYGRQTDITIDNLEMKLAQMAAENAGLKGAFDKPQAYLSWHAIPPTWEDPLPCGEYLDVHDEAGHKNSDGTDCWPVYAKPEIETPATDAFLAEVRASAITDALKSLEAEAVCVIDQSNLDYLKSGADADVWPASRKEMGDVLLYRTAHPAPAKAEPVAWLWSHRKHPSEVSLVRPEDDERAEGAHWSGWSCQALYAAPPAPVSDSLLSELLGIAKRAADEADEFAHAEFSDDSMEHSAAIADWERRAVMLQGSGRPQNEPQNIPENIPATQFKPVADLYGLTSPTGGETSFTFDAVEARDFIDGGWSCQEYVELGRYQEALTDHSEDKLAMVDHSGDSNNMVEPVTTACKLRDAVEIIRNSGIAIDAEKIFAERDALNAPDCWCRTCRPVTFSDSRFVVCPECGNKRCPHANDHRNACSGSNEPGQEGSAYPAAPQQEVAQALAKGMERYGDAMQELAKKEDGDG